MATRNRSRLFVSYARADDEPFVLRLVADLRRHGIAVWWDRDTMASRGQTFLQELRDAIWNADRVIAVIGPAALRSPYVRAEWEHALLFCRAVVPILRLGEHESFPPLFEQRAARLLPRLHTPDFRADADYPQRLEELLRLLRAPIAPAARLRGVSALPPHFLPRLQAIEPLEDALLADAVAPKVLAAEGRVAALVGQGGSGKSTVATAFCRDNLARRAFTDGIVWLGIGQQCDRLAILNRLGGLLDPRFKPLADAAQVRDRLAQALEPLVVLIVLDDVWQLADAEPFVALLGPRGRLLLTTRDSALAAAIGAAVHEVTPLESAPALQLLASWAGCSAGELPAAAQQVAAACGRLPFALSVCGGMAHTGTDWTDILDALQEADLAFLDLQLPQYPYRDLMKALAVGVDALARVDAAAAERYRELAVLPRDEVVPEAALLRLWASELGPRHARRLLTRLASKALLNLQVGRLGRTVRLHTLQHDYLLASKPDLASLHRRMIAAYESDCGGRWSEGADDGYRFRHLIEHLRGAGRQTEVDRLLVDPAWLVAKLAATDLSALLADGLHASPGHVAARAVGDALRLSAYAVAEDASLLIGQLLGRLLRRTEPAVVALVDRLAAFRDRPWLRPATACLIPAGGPLERILTRGSQRISSIVVDAGGSLAITASSFEKDLKVWDLNRGELIRTLPGARRYEVMELSHRRGPADALAVSPDGCQAVSALARPDLTLWDLSSGQPLETFAEHRDNVNAVVWRGDGRIVSVDRRGEVLLWDPRTLQVERRHTADASWLVSPDGRLVVTMNGAVLDVDTGAVVRRMEGLVVGHQTRAAFSADGQRLLAIEADGTARWWNFAAGARLGEAPQIAAQPGGVALSRDGLQAVFGYGAAAALWDLGQPTPKTQLRVHVEQCTAVAMTPDESRLLTASQELALWDLRRIRREAGSSEWPDEVMQVAISREHYAGGLWSGALVVWDRRSGRELHRALYPTRRPIDGCNGVAFSVDGQQLLFSNEEGLVAIRDLHDWDREQRYERGYVAALRPSACRVLTFGRPTLSELVAWDFTTGETACTITGYEHFKPHAFTPDGHKAAFVDRTDRLRVFDLDSGRPMHDLDGQGVVALVAASDSRHLIVGDARAGRLRVVDLDSGTSVATVTHEVGHGSKAYALSSDGIVLLAANDRGLLRAWALPDDRPIYELRPHASFVSYLGVSADDRFAVSTGSYDGVVQVWKLRSGAAVARFVAQSYFVDPRLSPDGFTLVANGMGEPVVLHLEAAESAAS